jgi:uncharacterized membrane protein
MEIINDVLNYLNIGYYFLGTIIALAMIVVVILFFEIWRFGIERAVLWLAILIAGSFLSPKMIFLVLMAFIGWNLFRIRKIFKDVHSEIGNCVLFCMTFGSVGLGSLCVILGGESYFFLTVFFLPMIMGLSVNTRDRWLFDMSK